MQWRTFPLHYVAIKNDVFISKIAILNLENTLLYTTEYVPMWNLGMKPISRHETSKIVPDDISNIIRICLIKLLLVSVHTFGNFKHFV